MGNLHRPSINVVPTGASPTPPENTALRLRPARNVAFWTGWLDATPLRLEETHTVTITVAVTVQVLESPPAIRVRFHSQEMLNVVLQKSIPA